MPWECVCHQAKHRWRWLSKSRLSLKWQTLQWHPGQLGSPCGWKLHKNASESHNKNLFSLSQHFPIETETLVFRESQSLFKRRREKKVIPIINRCYWKFHGSGKGGLVERITGSIHAVPHDCSLGFAALFTEFASIEAPLSSLQEGVQGSCSAPGWCPLLCRTNFDL